MRAEVLAPALQSSVAPKGCGPSVGIKEIFPAGRRLGTDQPDPSTRLAWPASWHHPRGRNRQGRGTLSRSQETGGHGLGLAVLRGGTLFHDGELILQNRTGGGLTALLRLPILRTDTQNSGEPGDTGRELADVAFTIIAITRGGSGMKRRDFMAGIGAAQVVLSSIPTVALAHGVQAYDAMVPCRGVADGLFTARGHTGRAAATFRNPRRTIAIRALLDPARGPGDALHG